MEINTSPVGSRGVACNASTLLHRADTSSSDDRDLIRERVIDSLVISAFEMDDSTLVNITDETVLGQSSDGLGFNEHDIVELGLVIEEDFGIDIPVDDWESWETVGDVVNYLMEKGE